MRTDIPGKDTEAYVPAPVDVLEHVLNGAEGHVAVASCGSKFNRDFPGLEAIQLDARLIR